MRKWTTPTWLNGPPPTWPRPLDDLTDRWAGLGARSRLAIATALAALLVVGVRWRVAEIERAWGGPPVTALVATEALPVGTAPTRLRAVALPPQAVPPHAVSDVPPDAALSFALPAGAVLTADHLDPRGPAAGLPRDQRAVPLPVEKGWAVAAGGWVDVWIAATGEDSAALVGRSRPVLQLAEDGGTALVGLHVDEVGPVTAALAVGRVLLTHAPPPTGGARGAQGALGLRG